MDNDLDIAAYGPLESEHGWQAYQKVTLTFSGPQKPLSDDEERYASLQFTYRGWPFSVWPQEIKDEFIELDGRLFNAKV